MGSEKKMDLKDHVRSLENQGFMVTSSSCYVLDRLVRVGRRRDHFERVPQHCWDDEDFRCGFDALRAEEGFRLT